MGFRLVPTSVTLNGATALILPYFTEFHSFFSLLAKTDPPTVRLSATDELLLVHYCTFQFQTLE